MTNLLELADVLDRAADLVSKGWTQGAFAKTAVGTPCSSDYAGASCWCAVGAINRAARHNFQLLGAIRCVEAHLRTEVLANWNDDPERTQSEVVEALRNAALRARASTQEVPHVG